MHAIFFNSLRFFKIHWPKIARILIALKIPIKKERSFHHYVKERFILAELAVAGMSWQEVKGLAQDRWHRKETIEALRSREIIIHSKVLKRLFGSNKNIITFTLSPIDPILDCLLSLNVQWCILIISTLKIHYFHLLSTQAHWYINEYNGSFTLNFYPRLYRANRVCLAWARSLVLEHVFLECFNI